MVRIGVSGDIDAVCAIVARSGGRVIARTMSVAIVDVSMRTVLDLAARRDVVSIVRGYTERSPFHRINLLDSDSVVARPYARVPPVDIDPRRCEYSVRTGDIDDLRTIREPLDRRYDGAGVLVAIVESGTIDFRHPDFLNADGTTRFVRIWDQSDSGNAPAPYGYGAIWTPDDLNREIRGETHRYREPPAVVKHVTEVAGVAAGSGRAIGRYCGVAPAATLVQVSILPTEVNLIEAVAYIFSVAGSLGMPCVINMSMQIAGDVSDGSNMASIAISEMVRERPGRIFVAAAGNNGHIRRHILYDGRDDGSHRSYWLGCSPSKRKFGLGSEYTHSVRVGNADMARLRLSFGALFYSSTESVRPEPTEAAEYSPEELVGHSSPCFVIRRDEPHDTLFSIRALAANLTDTTTIVELRITDLYAERASARADGADSLPRSDLRSLLNITISGRGVYEAWSEFFLSIVHPDRIPSFAPDYLLPDNLRTIDPPADGDDVLAVGAYVNAIDFVDRTGGAIRDTLDLEGDSVYPGEIYATTQPGGEYGGGWKPVVVTPGINVAAPVPLELEWDGNALGSSPWLYGGMHALFSGTSAAAPILAGAAALFMQKYPNATSGEFRQALMQTSYADVETGPVPNARTGYGKLDLFRLLCWTPDRASGSASVAK